MWFGSGGRSVGANEGGEKRKGGGGLVVVVQKRRRGEVDASACEGEKNGRWNLVECVLFHRMVVMMVVVW